jgi:hypothetical protein
MLLSVSESSALSWAAIERTCTRREARLLGLLIACAALTRALLVLGSPTAFGYIYDFYPAAVAYVYTHQALPPPSACWICAHPPLFWIVGSPFYALGMWLSHGRAIRAEQALCALPLLCDAVTLLYAYRLLRLYRQRGAFLLLGMALCAFFPCLAISSHGPESDVLLTALVVAGLFHLCRVQLQPARAGLADAAWLGLFCGLAAVTKYSGFLLLVSSVMLFMPRVLRGPRRALALKQAVVTLALALSLCGAQYAHNLQTQHTLLVANGSAQAGFDVLGLAERARNFRYYDFGSLRLRETVALFAPTRAPQQLTDEPVYASVWTTLHAMAWTDMSMFSVHERHGDPSLPYPAKHVPITLIVLMLYLGVLPTALACLGLASYGHRRSLRPLSLFGALTCVAYGWWFLAQDSWALKTKYILFLLPVYVLFALLGLRRLLALRGWSSRLVAGAVLGLLCLLLSTSLAYLTCFALA